MPQFLLITLAAPLASFGEPAGHERRGSRERPGKSALTGLLGAALGIRRDDREKQRALATTLETGVRVDNPGHALQDFHTAQYIPTARIKQPQTRRHALAALRHSDNAELTKRDYRMDVLYTAAFARLENCPWTLEQMANALRQPVFTLSLGRKSCPLSLPLHPRLIDAANMLEALEKQAAPEKQAQRTLLQKAATKPGKHPYAALPVNAPTSRPTNRNNYRIERVNDQPLDRKGWHFTERREAVFTLDTAPGEEQS